MIAQNIQIGSETLKNLRHETFCQLVATGKFSNSEAYRQSGYSQNNADVRSAELVVKSSIKDRISYLYRKNTEKREITRELQSNKLEDLQRRCKTLDDATGENAAIREQNKLYGLSIDKTEHTEPQEPLTAEDKAKAKVVADALLRWQQAKDRASEPTEVVLDDV